MGSENTSESDLPGGENRTSSGQRNGSRVRLLDDALVDQIAAGEVVERPASVVKELVENGLDAGAGRLRIDVRDGGIAWICVADDGRGMEPSDARLALQRHATSKIRHIDDLSDIGSFGFRGEALPAIASVSRLRLVTRREDAAEGFELRVDSGRIQSECSIGAPVGTRVEIADLFAHIPARRKFLKKPTTEWGHIADWLTRAAMGLPGVHFEVRRDDRESMVWPTTVEPIERIAALLSEAEAAALLRVEGESVDGHIEAFVSSPERTRGNAQGLYLFVNGRPVRDKLLRHAVLEVYRDWLPRGRYPSAIVFLTVPRGRVDVNVHPAKWEVRFHDPGAIHTLVRRSLRDGIASRSWLRTTRSPSVQEYDARGAVAAGSSAGPRTVPTASMGTAPTGPTAQMGSGSNVASDWVFAHPDEGDISGARDPQTSRVGETPDLFARSDDPETRPLRFGDLRLVGQFLASYLLVESKAGLLLIDQHAAHERVLYERLRAEWLENGVERQGLLAPMPIELAASAAAALIDAQERVSRLGFEIEAWGDAAVVVRAIPALLSGLDPQPLVRSLADELQEAASESLSERAARADDVRVLQAADHLFATLSCHSARRFGDHLEPREQQAILDGLDAIPWAPCCPHGRPVAVAFDLYEIERRFRRR